MKTKLKWALLAPAFTLCLAATAAQASTVTLTFGDLRNAAPITNYYDGGPNPFPPPVQNGPNDGVVFSGNANEQKAGISGVGTGKFEHNPSGVNGVLFFAFSNTTTSYLNDASGFSQLSFAYSTLNTSPDVVVTLWSGLSGAGTMLGTLTLSSNEAAGACTANARDEFCSWSTATLAGSGLAESATFGSNNSVDQTEFDKVVLSSAVPEPSTWAMMMLGFAAIGFVTYRRRDRGVLVG